MDKGRVQVDMGRSLVEEGRGQGGRVVAESQDMECHQAEVFPSTAIKQQTPSVICCLQEQNSPPPAESNPPTSPSLSPPGGPGVGTMPFFRHLSISTAFHLA